MTTVEPSKMVRTNILRCHARFVEASRKTLGFVLEMLSAYLSMSNFRFCCRTCREILVDILSKRNLGHVSLHLCCFLPKIQLDKMLGNQFAEKFATTSISQRGICCAVEQISEGQWNSTYSNSTRLLPFCFHRVGSQNLETKKGVEYGTRFLHLMNYPPTCFDNTKWVDQKICPSIVKRFRHHLFVHSGIPMVGHTNLTVELVWIPMGFWTQATFFSRKIPPQLIRGPGAWKSTLRTSERHFVRYPGGTSQNHFPWRLDNPWRWWENPRNKNPMEKNPGNVKSSMANLIWIKVWAYNPVASKFENLILLNYTG